MHRLSVPRQHVPSMTFWLASSVLLLALSGCSHEVAPSGCVQDADCFGDGEVCVQGECALLDDASCQSDLDCNTNAGEGCLQGICTAGAQAAGGACSATRDCPVNNYCNTATSQCQPLLSGWCREAAQCTGSQTLCSATTTDVPGRCVECLRDTDCGSGGTCVNPGVCELSDTRGPEEPGPGPGPGPDPGTDPGTDPTEDVCEANDWYGDGYCDEDCLNPDPDCTSDGGGGEPTEDYCEQYGWYGDGECDDFCVNPDPDCAGGGDGGGTAEPDYCEDAGYYGDGAICDDFCPQPDPDCDATSGGGGGDDTCADYGWYGDGICDSFCLNPDPDCAAAGSGLLENDSCVQGGQLLECAEGLDCIYESNSSGAPSYGSCKRICSSNTQCGSGQQCALGFLASGDGICGAPLGENQQGCTFWEQSGSFCFDGSGSADSAFLECLSGTCKFICDYTTNSDNPLDCPGTSSCGSSFNTYEGYSVGLAVCQ